MHSTNRKKILFFINRYSGGAEKMTLNIAGFLPPELYDVVFYIVGPELASISRFLPPGIPVHLLRINSYKDYFIFKLVKILLKEKPDCVFASLMPINWRLCFAAAFMPGIRLIIRADCPVDVQSFHQNLRLWLAYRRADKLIMQTQEMRKGYIEKLNLPNKKVITLENPVNQKEIARKLQQAVCPFEEDGTHYVFIGRVDPVKGLDILISAFAKVLQGRPDARLYIVGEVTPKCNDYFSALKHQADDLQIAQNVFFTGFDDNPYRYIKYADCLVLPSRTEGLPNAVIEALFIGTPVAVTNCVPIINRIVKEGVNGHVVEVDDAAGLARAMIATAKLGRVQSFYSPAQPEDFVQLFC
ncbi:glycosyltransferase [Niabella sp.]|uniref:glycosyltransferase n=1 Tax=Niabella sp. TaxID=1962976 RepID=UPI002625A235|nr:glycosyltransferase [Niabella sp.]